MPTIFTIGETVYDIMFERGVPKAAKAGGAMLNSAVSLGRCGLRVEMITELGQDRIGAMVMEFLRENGVSTSFIRPGEGFKTPVAMAFLDERGDAQYSFYKNYPERRLEIDWPAPARGDVVLFGSFYSIDPAVHGMIAGFVAKAKNAGAMVVYDPNMRKNHLHEIGRLMPNLRENFGLADIVRGSDEDFINLFGKDDVEQVYHYLRDMGCGHLICTRSLKGAYLLSNELRHHVPAKNVQVVSTIGAGDSFNAGIIFGLVKKNLTGIDLSLVPGTDWAEVLGYGIEFASEVCASYDNYISKKSF
jgi:fructokinase